jgi:pimeloyl-ACP methyl ester carboxylesterase
MSDQPETVVLVHGLWMHGLVFWPQRRWLASRGFAVRSFSYPSVRHSLADNSRALARFVAGLPASRIHLVGHSLGGLVVLAMLAEHPDQRIRRAVLMGSPCGGSHCAEVLLGSPALAAIVGRSIRDWLRLPRPQPPATVDIGVLAGNRRLGLGRIIPGLPRPNDGVVSVAETRLATARDSITLPVGHSQMLVSPACAEQITAFLRNGRFIHG